MDVNYRLLAETLLLENSSFNGEFWIQDHFVQQADSNIDMGHEAYVLQSAASQILSDIDIHDDESYLPDMEERVYEEIQDQLPEDMQQQYADGELSIIDCLKYYGTNILKNKDYPELVDAAYDKIDLRRYAMRKWGWKAIRGKVVDTWNLTSDDLRKISHGLYEAYSHEFDEYDDESVDEHGYKGPYFDIEVYSRGDYYYNVPWDLIHTDVSKILPYRTITRGERITENEESISRNIKLTPVLSSTPNPELQKNLDDLSEKYGQYLDADAYAYNEYIKLEELLAKRNAPIGTGSAYMNELCKIADEHNRIIVLTVANRGYGGFAEFKKTTGMNRLKKFYARFGFVSNYSSVNMQRMPKKTK